MVEPGPNVPPPPLSELVSAEPTSITTLLLRRLAPDAFDRARPVLALAPGHPVPCSPEGTVYVLVDVGASEEAPLAAALATRRSARDVVLDTVAVVPQWRGRGLGGRLLAEVIDDLRADGVLAVWALVPHGDSVCSRLFARRGFDPADLVPPWAAGDRVAWRVLQL